MFVPFFLCLISVDQSIFNHLIAFMFIFYVGVNQR
uniref:Uncharacterized protein n=1 Tax=Rhizophora mucronata TaxID=61149 RepID=A0A2P2IVQ5_RHIMU